MKKTGNSKQIAGVTVYEYKGYYDYSEEPEEGVYIENKAPLPFQFRRQTKGCKTLENNSLSALPVVFP